MARKKNYKGKKEAPKVKSTTTLKTRIVCILDSSGSMSSTIDEARQGFNDYIKEQKKANGQSRLTVALFDTHTNYEIIYDNEPLSNTKPLTSLEWHPRGMTALYDGIGRTVSHVRKNGQSEKMNTLCVIVTDGYENDSKEYSREDVKSLIKDLEDNHGWTFIYMGSDPTISAVEAGTSIGISAGNTLQFSRSAAGTSNAYFTLNDATALYYTNNGSSDSIVVDDLISKVTDGTGEVGDEKRVKQD